MSGMRPTFKGSIRIGLLNVPISVFTATNDRNDGIEFHQMHAECNTRIKQKKWCESCEKEVSAAELVKGYEHSKGEYTIVTQEELDAQRPESHKAIDIDSFAHASEIDARRFDSAYYLGPDGPVGIPAFTTMRDALHDRMAIGKLLMHGREKLVAIGAMGRAMVMHVLRTDAELRPIENVPSYDQLPIESDKKFVKVAEKLFDSLTEPLDLSEYSDEYRENVIKLLQAKLAGQAPTPVVVKEPKPTNDLMSALEASLNLGKKAKKAKVVSALPVKAQPTKAEPKSRRKTA